MKSKKQHIDFGEIIRYGIVGGIATAIHYGVYALLQLWLSVNIAYTCGYIVSLGCNFILSARFTFKKSPSLPKAGGFVASHLINYLLHIGLLNLFLYCGVSQMLSPLLVFCIVIPVNFILVRFVFNHL